MLASLVKRNTDLVVPREAMNLLPAEYRDGQIGWQDWLALMTNFTYNGVNYVVPGASLAEMTAFQGKQDPIVFACMALRAAVFSEIRHQFQSFSNGRPSKLFGTPALSLIETPWPTGTTRDVLSRAEWDISLYGNSYWVREMGGDGIVRLIRLDPTRVKIGTASLTADEGQMYGQYLVAYIAQDFASHEIKTYLPEEVIHYKPIPDPDHPFRGQSWLSTILPEIGADMSMTQYKNAFLGNAATPNIVVTFAQGIGEEAIGKFRDRVESTHTGPRNGFKTLYVGNGADVKAIGANFQEMNFGAVQSQGETRIAAAAGCPPSLLGLAEGLKGSTLNAGNFSNVARSFADRTVRPLWGAWCGAASTLIVPPQGSRLWYSESEVPFLQADETDSAQIRLANASTMLNLVNSGYSPDSVVLAVTTNDFTLLTHTGLFSVQLQAPLTGDPLTAVPNPVGGGLDAAPDDQTGDTTNG